MLEAYLVYVRGRVEPDWHPLSRRVYTLQRVMSALWHIQLLVIGVEKMTEVSGAQVGDLLIRASYLKEEGETEGGFAGVFGGITANYFQKHGDQSDALARIAPVTAIRGNIDRGPWAEALPETVSLTIGGLRIHMIHDRKALQVDPAAEGWNVVISGHSHKPGIEEAGGTLWLNPGAAGPRRFRLPRRAGRKPD